MKKTVLLKPPSFEILFEFGTRFANRVRRNIQSAERIMEPIKQKLDLPRE